MSTENAEKVVATEAAEADFARWAEAMDLTAKLDPSQLDDADKKSLAVAKGTILRAIEAGRLVVDGNGEFIFTPQSGGGSIKFHEPTGASLIAMDAKAKGQDQTKMLAAVADFTKTPIARFAAMPFRDLNVCLSIAALFLG